MGSDMNDSSQPASAISVRVVNPIDVVTVQAAAACVESARNWLGKKGMHHWDSMPVASAVANGMKNGLLLVARMDGKVCGSVGLDFSTPDYHLESDKSFWENQSVMACYVRRLSTMESHMGKGIGTKLLEAAEHQASECGAYYTRLDTNPAFPYLVGYYANRGYLKVGERDGHSFFEKRLH